MRKLHVVGLALFAMFAFSAIAASSAFAAVEWLKNNAAITTPVNVTIRTSSELLLITDMKGGAFGEEVDVLCPGTGTGTVGPGVEDTVRTVSVTAANCEVMSGLCNLEEVAAVNLPWLTELTLVTVGGVDLIRDTILNGNISGEPGWLVKCSGVDDKCETLANEPGFTEMENLAGGIVDAVFHENESPAALCSRSGPTNQEGLVNGLLEINAGPGESLTVNP